MSDLRIVWRDMSSDGRACECHVERTTAGAFVLSLLCGDEIIASELLYDEAQVDPRAAAMRRILCDAPAS